MFPKLQSTYNRKNFESTSSKLNDYIQKTISQDIKRNAAQCYVALEENNIIGFYTLSVTSIPNFSKDKKLPSYSELPVALLGRLAVDKNYSGSGIGSALVYDAIERSILLSNSIGICGVVVDLKDIGLVSFYEKLGFNSFDETKPLKMVYFFKRF